MNEYIELRIPPCADLECLPQPGHESGSVCISNVVWKEEEEEEAGPTQHKGTSPPRCLTWACSLAFWLCHSSWRRWISGVFSSSREFSGGCRPPPSLRGTSIL